MSTNTHEFATCNDIPERTRATMIMSLNQQLADTFDLYSQTKRTHWNVTGANFYQLHLPFDEMAKSLIEIRDSIAERGMAPGWAQCASRIISYPSSKRT